MQDLKEVTGKVRRVSETQFSPRQHTKGLALLASDADSGESPEVLLDLSKPGQHCVSVVTTILQVFIV